MDREKAEKTVLSSCHPPLLHNERTEATTTTKQCELYYIISSYIRAAHTQVNAYINESCVSLAKYFCCYCHSIQHPIHTPILPAPASLDGESSSLRRMSFIYNTCQMSLYLRWHFRFHPHTSGRQAG